MFSEQEMGAGLQVECQDLMLLYLPMLPYLIMPQFEVMIGYVS